MDFHKKQCGDIKVYYQTAIAVHKSIYIHVNNFNYTSYIISSA